MILPSIHFVAKQWRSSLFRTIVIINRRQLATSGQQQKQTSKSQENDSLVQSTTNNQIEVATFKEKGSKYFLRKILYIIIVDYSSTSC
jgi:hypothetical protein